MASYINAINDLIVERAETIPNVVLFGENIDNGSFISGLTRGLRVGPGGRILNVGDCEATHCGVGFGMLLGGVTSILFAKQLDFMLLGMDHFVNTYNFIRCQPKPLDRGSFTIISIVCDQGFQGPQSSFNGLGEICSLARVPGYSLTNRVDSMRVLESQLCAPGFRFIALSQRLFSSELLTLPCLHSDESCGAFQYFAGTDVTIVCLNFSLPQGVALRDRLLSAGMTASLFSVNYVPSPDWSRVAADASQTKRLVVIDDAKGVNSPGYALMEDVARRVPDSYRAFVRRGSSISFDVGPDELAVDYDGIISELATGRAAQERRALHTMLT